MNEEEKDDYLLMNIKDYLMFPLLTSSKTQANIGDKKIISTYSYLTTKFQIYNNAELIKEKTMKELTENCATLNPRIKEEKFAHLHTEPVAFLIILERMKEYNNEVSKNFSDGLLVREMKQIVISFYSWHAPCNEQNLRGCKQFLIEVIQNEVMKNKLKKILNKCKTDQMELVLLIERPQKNELEEIIKTNQ